MNTRKFDFVRLSFQNVFRIHVHQDVAWLGLELHIRLQFAIDETKGQAYKLVFTFSGAFAKFRKSTITFVMSVCPHGTTGSHWTNFDETWYFGLFRKSVEKIQVTASRMRVACWITKATCTFSHAHAHAPGVTRTHSHTDQYVILISFPRQPDSRTRLAVALCVYCFSCCRVKCAVWIYTFGKSWLHYWVLSNRIERLTWEVLLSIYHSR